MKETILRSFVKTFSWRVFNLIADFVIVYFLTGQPVVAGGFAVISFVVTFVAYFAHERVWNEITWGKS